MFAFGQLPLCDLFLDWPERIGQESKQFESGGQVTRTEVCPLSGRRFVSIHYFYSFSVQPSNMS